MAGQLIGEPAMAYVTRSGEQNVAGAGRAVGYDSEAAFSRAFKRIMGGRRVVPVPLRPATVGA